MNTSNKSLHKHYRWTVLAMGTLGVFGALGLARFGYTTVLPSMQSDLGINNQQAGLLATYNLLGYLAMAMTGGMLASRYGARAVASAGLLIAGTGMLLTGTADSFSYILALRALTGIGSGAANVAIMGLWPAWFPCNRRGMASGIAVSGSSVALILTGIFVPRILLRNGDAAWRSCWLAYGVITIFLALISYVVIRNNTAGAGLTGDQMKTKQSQGWKKVFLSAHVWSLGLIYTAFGFSYIIYTTFFIKYLISDHGYSDIRAGNLFMLMGWCSLLCGLIWGAVSDRIGRRNALAALYLFNTAAFALFAFGSTHRHMVLSAVIYGLSAWSIPAIMAAACGDFLGRRLAPAAIGFITLFMGIGQAAGPVAAGAIADASGSFPSAFMLASAVSLAGALGALLLLKNNRERRADT